MCCRHGAGRVQRAGREATLKILKRAGLRVAVAAAVSAGLTAIGHASTVHAITATATYNLNLDANGTFIPPVGTVTIVSNITKDTLTYTFNLFDRKNSLTQVFLDAGATARHDLGSTTNSFGTFTDSFTARGRKFSITFSGTIVADFLSRDGYDMYAAVATVKGLFGNGASADGGTGSTTNLLDPPVILSAPDAPTATPLPAALPLFATGLGAIGLLGWRRKRKAARQPSMRADANQDSTNEHPIVPVCSARF
jgi:hypothetical protein